MSNQPNWLDLGLSQDEEKYVREVSARYQASQLHSFEVVMETAKVIELLRERYYGCGYQGSYGQALVQYGFVNRSGEPIDKGIRSNYKTLLDNEETVRAWWAKVKEGDKNRWMSARAIHRAWDRSRKPPRLRTEPTLREKDADSIRTLEEENLELRKQLKDSKAHVEELEVARESPHDADDSDKPLAARIRKLCGLILHACQDSRVWPRFNKTNQVKIQKALTAISINCSTLEELAEPTTKTKTTAKVTAPAEAKLTLPAEPRHEPSYFDDE